jgi:hypothetical protein
MSTEYRVVGTNGWPGGGFTLLCRDLSEAVSLVEHYERAFRSVPGASVEMQSREPGPWRTTEIPTAPVAARRPGDITGGTSDASLR